MSHRPFATMPNTRWAKSLAVCAVATAVMALCSAPLGHTATARSTSALGTYLSGQGRILKADFSRSALVVDNRGGDHVLIYDDDNAHVVYASRPGSTSRWTKQHVVSFDKNEKESENNSTSVSAVLSANGKQVDAIVHDCRGVYTTAVSRTAAHLHEFGPALKEDSAVCNHDDDSDEGPFENYIVSGAVALAHDRLELLVYNINQNETQLYIGKPGHRFAPVAKSQLSGQASYLTQDVASGRLYATFGGANTVAVISKIPAHAWTAPVTVASGTINDTLSDNVYVDSLAALRGRVWVVLGHTLQSNGNGAETNGAPTLATRTRSGHWSTPVDLPHTNKGVSDVLLLANSATGTLHAAFGAAGSRHGVLKMGLVKGTWSKPTVVTHRASAKPAGIALNQAGDLVVAYAVNI